MTTQSTTSFPVVSTAAQPLAGSVQDLYAVYYEIAKRDHAVRRAALYGDQAPPAGHTPFRPLPQHHFEARFVAAAEMPGGEEVFRRQLARQASVYGVETRSVQGRQAA